MEFVSVTPNNSCLLFTKRTKPMTRQQVVLLLRKLLLRMEEEEFELSEYCGNTSYPDKKGFLIYTATGWDTYTLKFLGSKKNSHIPPVTVVYCDGKTEERSYTNIRGLHNVVHMYCPINPSTITPEKHRLKVLQQFQLSNVQYIKEN